MITREEFVNAKVRKEQIGNMGGYFLMLGNRDVMGYDEKDTIKKQVRELCKEHKPQRVLEIGFGLGFTATEFQEQGIKEHTIVEAHPVIFKRAEKWRKKYSNKKINLINRFIQDFKYDEKDYDLIYDDRDELVEELEAGTTFPNWKIIK